MRFWILFLGLMTIAIPDHIYAQGTVQQVVGDLVYVKGLSADLDGKLRVAGDDGAVLQVIKVLSNVVVARVVEENGSPVKSGDRTQVDDGTLVGSPRRVVHAMRVAAAPRIDGRLNDAVWRQAQAAEGFVQRDPKYWMPVTERTVVKIIYDNEKIYFGFECYDKNPGLIVTNNMRRDSQLSGDDNIQLLLDPFNDKQNGVFFIINALGARADMLLSNEGRTTNEDWDCIWEARCVRHEMGWTAEIAIPFDQLRFNPSDEMEWGINMGRYIGHKNEETAFIVGRHTPSPRRRYQMTDMGVLRGLKAVERKRLFQVKPYVLPGTSRNFAGDEGENRTFEAGADVRYGLTSNLALDVSYNTDFAQVEADQEQVNLTQFSQFFPEKREFFLEGAQLFDFGEAASTRGGDVRPPTLLFYSRRIGLDGGQPVPILAGGKLAGKAGRTSIGALNVLTDSEMLDTQTLPRRNFSVLRIKRDVFARSNVGFIWVNKQSEVSDGGWGDYNRAGGLDFSFSPSTAVNVQAFYARTWDRDSEEVDDARYLRFSYSGTKYAGSATVLEVEDNFEPEAGFVNRRRGIRGFRRYNVNLSYLPRPRVANIRNLRFTPDIQVIEDDEGEVPFQRFRLDGVLALQTADRFLVRVERTRDVVTRTFRPSSKRPDVAIPPREYTFTSFRLGPDTANYRKLQLDFDFLVGTYYTGHLYRVTAENAYRPNGRLGIELIYDGNWIRLPQANLNIQALSTRLIYSFTTDFFFKIFAQWNSDSESVGANFLLNYRFRPGSDIFFVYDHGFGTDGDLHQTSRAVLLKVSYLIGL